MELENAESKSKDKSEFLFGFVVKNTSDDPQDVYLFDQSGKLNSNNIRIDSQMDKVDYKDILGQVANIGYKKVKASVHGFDENVYSCFGKDYYRILIRDEKPDGEAMAQLFDLYKDPYQVQLNVAKTINDFSLNVGTYLKFRLKGWTKLVFRFYGEEAISRKNDEQ